MSDEDKGAVEEEIDVLLLLPLRRHRGSHQHIYLLAAYTPCIRINTATKTPFLIIASDAAILRVMVFPCRHRQGELSGPAGAVVFPVGSLGDGVELYIPGAIYVDRVSEFQNML